MKKLLALLLLPLLFTGCNATLTNLTPQQQTRSTNNLYTVEVAMASKQQALRWNSIKPLVVVGSETYEMRQTPLMSNRWEAVIPVAPEKERVTYHYKFDFDYNSLGQPRPDSAISPTYTLRIVEEKK
jgi:hypothetical protein